MALSLITFGLALPYFAYWSLKYFFTKLSVDGNRLQFTGSFGEYFLSCLGLLILCVFTFGLAIPYFSYWNYKYFFCHLELPAETRYAV